MEKKKPISKRKVWRRIALFAAAMVLCIGFAGANSRYLKEDLFNQYISLDYPSSSTVDTAGNVYVIDQSKQRVVAFSQDGHYLYQILGGSRQENSFYSAEDIKADENGNLYLLDVVLAADGSAIEKERIIKFDKKGRYVSSLYEMVYEEEDRPLMSGRIQSLTLTEDSLEFLFSEADQITLMSLPLTGESPRTLKQIAYDTKYLISYGIQEEENRIYAVTKMADILEIHDDGTDKTVYRGAEHDSEEFFSIPWQVAVDQEGRLYFTDIGLRNIGVMETDGSTSVAIEREDPENLGNNRIFYSLDVSGDGKLTAIADVDVYVRDPGTDVQTVIYGNDEGRQQIAYSGSYLGFRAAVYASAVLAVIFLLLLLLQVLKLNLKFHFSAMARNNLMIIVVSVIIALVSIPSVMNAMQKQYQEQVMNNMSSVAEMACKALNAEDVEQINTPQDYTSPAYERVKASIQDSFSTANGWNEGLYCVLNRVSENKIIYSCLYLEDTVGSVYPLDYDYEETEIYRSISDSGYGSEYKELYETGRQIKFDWIENVDGIWTYVLSPVINDDGEVVAAMEVGTNLYAFQEANNAMIREMIFNIVSIIAIIILIFTELSFIWFSRDSRRREVELSGDPEKKGRELAVYVIRPMIFIIFMADCMATAFLPMLANQLAVPMWGIPAEMMSAIPVSTEVLLTAIFAFAGGFLLEKFGFRKILLGGSVLFTAGLIAAGASDSILPFIGAKAIIGIGMGLLLVGINTLVASYPEKESTEGFSFYNAGSLAGLTVGTTVGSILAAPLGYLKVYFVAAAISGISLAVMFFTLKKDTIYPPMKQEKEEETGKISIFQFLFKKELLLFFFCAMVPYMLYGYFLNYFMPLFAESQGMSETAIGQLFLINGVCVIYLGPSLTSFILGRLKAKWAVIAAGVIYAVTLILFVMFTGNGMVVVTALLFGIADSFGFSALSVYFSGLDAVKSYGSSKAMGVYSTFDNISQTMGPFVFSAVFVMGIRRSILLLAVIYLILLCLYMLFGKKTSDK